MNETKTTFFRETQSFCDKFHFRYDPQLHTLGYTFNPNKNLSAFKKLHTSVDGHVNPSAQVEEKNSH
jgi:hypothetical protein